MKAGPATPADAHDLHLEQCSKGGGRSCLSLRQLGYPPRTPHPTPTRALNCREWSSDQAAVLHFTYNRFRCARCPRLGAATSGKPTRTTMLCCINYWTLNCIPTAHLFPPHPPAATRQRPQVSPGPLRLRANRGGRQALLHPAL